MCHQAQLDPGTQYCVPDSVSFSLHFALLSHEVTTFSGSLSSHGGGVAT